MRKRRHIPIRWVRLLLKRQGGTCAVKDCGTVLILPAKGRKANYIKEHKLALARGGKDILKNLELRCVPHADKKTFHPRSLATTICGDNYEIKKNPRLRRKHKVVKPPLGTQRPERAKRPWPKQKLRSRGFPEARRPMRGTT